MAHPAPGAPVTGSWPHLNLAWLPGPGAVVREIVG